MALTGAYTGMRTYSALENGVTAGTANQQAQLQKLADDIGTAGGGVLAIPTGALISIDMKFYSGTAPSGFAAGLRLPNNVHLQLDGELRQCPNQPHGKWKYNGAYSLLRTKDANDARNVRVFGRGTLNGNSANNALNDYHFDGLNYGRGLGLRAEGITIKNIRGTGGGPPNETFGFIAYRSTNTLVENVTITSDDGGLSSTGMADSYSFGLTVNNVIVDNMQTGQGFALHATGQAHFTNCRAWRVHSNAFNLELPSGPVTYTSCHSGGKFGPDYKGMGAEAYTVGQDLGCGNAVYHAGFQFNCDGSFQTGWKGTPHASVLVQGCSSTFNKNGVGVRTHDINRVPIVLIGNDFRYNENYGIINNGTTTAQMAVTAQDTWISRSNRLTNNAKGAIETPFTYAD